MSNTMADVVNVLSEPVFYAYTRVSTRYQKEDRALLEIERFCKERGITLAHKPFVDKATGKNFNRERYIVMKEDVLRPNENNVLIISELDRLGRNKFEILKELTYFKENGIRVMILELPTTLIDFNFDSEINKMLFDTIQDMLIQLYATLAHAEMEKRTKRMTEGIEAMKLRGDWDKYGRPHAVSEEKFDEVYKRVLNKEIRPCDAMKELQLSSATYYRYKKYYEERNKSKAP